MQNYNRRIHKLAIVASLGGFLFGYDTAIISGTIGFVSAQYDLEAVSLGWYVSSALIGCILGVAGAGLLSDRYGRKPMLLAAGVLFAVSAIGCMLAGGYDELIGYRFIGGIGVGVASMLSPLYISEIAPAAKRGSLVTLYQFAITLGILFAYFANAYLLGLSETVTLAESDGLLHTILVAEVWRIMLGSETVPALTFLLLLLTVPRSPRWLTMKGRDEQAVTVLNSLMGRAEANAELAGIRQTIGKESAGLGLIFKGGFKTAMVIGIALAFHTQISGINAIIYYGPRVLEEAGLQIGEALGGQVIIGVVNALCTLIAILTIDKWGRRPLLLTGVVGIVFSLTAVGGLFYADTQNPYLLMSFILLFIACFAFSYGPVIWVLLSEIYPLRIRGTAMSVATLSLWIGTALVGQTTPWLLENLQPHGTFWLFAIVTLPAVYIALRVIPETKGKSLEEIEHHWLNQTKKTAA